MIINPTVVSEGRPQDIFSLNLGYRNIYLNGEITPDMNAVIIAQLLYLDNTGSEPIKLNIFSHGGEVSAGLGIIDTMKNLKCQVHTINTGVCASMGALIFAAGEKGHRYMLPHSEIMIHQPLGGSNGQATDIEIAATHIIKTKNLIADMMSYFTGHHYKEIVQDIERDKWMNAEEAVWYGLADKIL